MNYSTARIFGIAILILATVSCDRPECQNTNPIFDRFTPAQEEYKLELVKQVKGRESKLRYWLDRYEEKNNREYLMVFIQGDSLCAKAEILIENWEGIEGIRRVKGKGYSGAELAGFKYDVHFQSERTTFSYRGVDRIVD
jgi:hypothetical protein